MRFRCMKGAYAIPVLCRDHLFRTFAVTNIVPLKRPKESNG
jgi:hypothetical protein